MLTPDERRAGRRNVGLMVLLLFAAGFVSGWVFGIWWPV